MTLSWSVFSVLYLGDFSWRLPISLQAHLKFAFKWFHIVIFFRKNFIWTKAVLLSVILINESDMLNVCHVFIEYQWEIFHIFISETSYRQSFFCFCFLKGSKKRCTVNGQFVSFKTGQSDFFTESGVSREQRRASLLNMLPCHCLQPRKNS